MRNGAPSAATVRLRRTLRDIIDNEQYEAVILGLVDIALHSKDSKARVAAIKTIIEYYEGKVPDKIEHSINGSPTIKDILSELKQ